MLFLIFEVSLYDAPHYLMEMKLLSSSLRKFNDRSFEIRSLIVHIRLKLEGNLQNIFRRIFAFWPHRMCGGSLKFLR